MKEGERNVYYFRVCKTLNKLGQYRDVSTTSFEPKPFGAIMNQECTRYYDAYSFAVNKEILLYTDGITQDINLNDCVFSYVVKGYKNIKRNDRIHTLILEGCWPNGVDFSFPFSLHIDMDELPAIIYAMVILSETKDVDRATNLWGIIRQEYYMGTARRLQLIMDGEAFFKGIIEKYPFMTQVVKDGLDFHIGKVKEDIQTLEFLK